MNKAVILRALDRIDLDKDDLATVENNVAIIRCEMRSTKLPPLVTPAGVAVELSKGKRYLLFLQQGTVEPEEIEALVPAGCKAIFTPGAPEVHAVEITDHTVIFVRPGVIDKAVDVPGVRFVELFGTGPIADAVSLRPDALTAALEICEDPAWADGLQIAEKIRRL